jgi:hypothetical protein
VQFSIGLSHAGNQAIRHLFFNIPLDKIAPYVAVIFVGISS